MLDERVQERLGLRGPGLDLALVRGRVAGATDGRDDGERAATESDGGKGTYLTVPAVYSVEGSTASPFSTGFSILNTASDIATAKKTDESASWRPGQMLRKGRAVR